MTIVVTVIGWFVVSFVSAQDDPRASLREDRQDTYLALFNTAESCIDIANAPVVQRDFAVWLSIEAPTGRGDTRPEACLGSSARRATSRRGVDLTRRRYGDPFDSARRPMTSHDGR